MKKYLLGALLACFLILSLGASYGTLIYMAPGGGEQVIQSGGKQSVKSGGIVNFETGSYLKLNNTAITTTAAEVNKLAGVTAGTTSASKALVVGSTRMLNYLGIQDTLELDSALERVKTGSAVDFESGSYFRIAGTQVTGDATELNYIDGTILGTAVASKVLGLSAARGVNYLAVSDTLLGDSAVWRLNTGSTLQIDSGASFTINGSPVTTSNLWTGTTSTQQILADSTLTSATSGYTYWAYPIAAKTTAILPSASAGLNYRFFVADSDSLLLTTASGDSIISTAGTAYKTTSSVAGNIYLIAVNATYWLMVQSVGTWTSY